jgi:hypothetical protein
MEMKDERIAKAIDLFQEAWMLLGNLAEVRQRLPPADMPPTGKLPADWSEERSYAVCVHLLETSLRQALHNVVTGLDFRKEFQIRHTILPAEAKFGLTGQAWLDQRDKLMGEEPES